MEEIYIYNGKEYTRQQIQGFATKAGAPSFDAYVSQFGIQKKESKKTNASETYSYKGKDYSLEEVNELATKAGAPSTEAYINQFGLKKKEEPVLEVGGNILLSGGAVGGLLNGSGLAATKEAGKGLSESDISGIKNYIQGLKTPDEIAAVKSIPTKEQATIAISKANPLTKSGVQKSLQQVAGEERKAKVDAVAKNMYEGVATLQDINEIAKLEEAKPLLSSYLNVYGDKSKNTTEQDWKQVLDNGNFDNRSVSVAKIDENVKYADQVIEGLKGAEVSFKETMFSNESRTGAINETIPNFDSNSASDLSLIMQKISYPTFKLKDSKGNDVNDKKAEIINAIQYKLWQLERVKPIDKEIDTPEFTSKIEMAIGEIEYNLKDITVSDLTQKTPNVDEKKIQAFKRGLNSIKYTDPGTYHNVINSINKKEQVAEMDYQSLVGKGQFLENFNTFIGGATNKDLIGAETNFNLETKSSKVAKTSGIFGEFFKQAGISKGHFSDEDIDYATERIDWAAHGMTKPTKKELSFIKSEEDRLFYDQIPKNGSFFSFVKGAETPFLAVARTVQDVTSGSSVQDYLRSKELNRAGSGGQLTPNEKGQYGQRLASDRGSIWYDMLEGAGAFIPQILLTKGLGTPFASVAEASVASAVPRAALTAEQLFNINTVTGTLLSSYLQSYGDGYEQALQKTGDPVKAEKIGVIGGIIDGVMEQWLPETRIGRGIVKNIRGDVSEKIAAIVRNGGDPADILNSTKNLLKPFISEYLNVTGQEMAEEGTAVLLKQMAETIISPETAATNDVMSNLGQTLWSTAIQTFIPAIGSGGAASKNRFTQKVFNQAAIKYDYSVDALKRSLLNEMISQDEYNKSISILSIHRNSIANAPKADIDGAAIPAKQRLEYAYQETRVKINEEKSKAKWISDVEKEVLDKKIKESQDIQRGILMPKKDGSIKTGNTKDLNAAKVFTDFDNTLFKDGKLTPLGEDIKTRVADGEDISILTAREATPENIQLIKDQIGIDEKNIVAGLTPEGKAGFLTAGSTFYDDNEDNLAAAKKIAGVNVVDSKAPETTLFDRVQESGNDGIKQLYSTPESITELQDQALTTPSNINEKLGGNEELTTDLIAQNGEQKINAAIQALVEKQKNPDTTDQETEEIDSHINLLEKGLAKTVQAAPAIAENQPKLPTVSETEGAGSGVGDVVKPNEKVAELEAERDMAILREKVPEMNPVKEVVPSVEEVSAGSVGSEALLVNKKKRQELKNKYSELKKLFECLTKS